METSPKNSKTRPVFKGTQIRFSTASVGPKWDPYARDTLVVSRNGHEYEHISCALAGVTFRMDGKTIAGPAHEREEIEEVERMFAEAAGARSDQFINWYFTRVHVEDPMDEYYRGWY